MITIKSIKKLIKDLPDEAELYEYSSYDDALVIIMPDGEYKVVRLNG